MKPTFKVLIVANNANWLSWPTKVSWLQNFFQPIATLVVDVIHTNLPTPPFINFTAVGTQYEQINGPMQEIDPAWYAKNVTPLAAGYDVSVFVLPESQWPLLNCMRGITLLNTAKPIPCSIASDENEAVYQNGIELFSTAQHYMAHELSHALFELAGTPFAQDTTHYWDFAIKNLDGVLQDIKFKQGMTTDENAIYSVLKAKLGTHLTLNNNVPAEVGCAECVSAIFKLAGFAIPAGGIQSTAALLAWAQTNPRLQAVSTPEQGGLIISATGSGNGSFPGHTGFFGGFGTMYANDWGICSNDSNTGTLREQWSYKQWVQYYEHTGGMKTHLFRVL